MLRSFDQSELRVYRDSNLRSILSETHGKPVTLAPENQQREGLGSFAIAACVAGNNPAGPNSDSQLRATDAAILPLCLLLIVLCPISLMTIDPNCRVRWALGS